MMNQTIDETIEEVIADLAAPVSGAELADGWTAESKEAIKKSFEELKKKIRSGEALPPLNISRALDHWGVVGGKILEKSARISNNLRLRSPK